ncbi:MAG: TolC family protein [Acidobacteria bacterium]|nr:TolC family protein [Acidobacteriota bacterium]
MTTTPTILRHAVVLRAAAVLACVILMVGLMASLTPAAAQAPPAARRDYSQDLEWTSLLKLQQFRPQPVPEPVLENAATISSMLSEGKMSLSISQLVRAVVENNLSVDSARYTVSIADTDLLKSRAGQNLTGTEAASIPPALGSVSFGAGTGGGSRNSAGSVNVTPRGSFDPSLTLSFSIDNNTTPLNNTRVTGVPSVTAHTNTVQTRYAQAFATGTSFSFNFNVQRASSTSRNQRFNPSFTSNYNLSVNQQLLSGFGPSMNRRYQKIAETNRQTAKQFFALQLIAQLTQAENQYWDLVAAKERVRSSEQSLQVSEQLLSDNRKQAEIGTLAPLDVISAESEVAGRRRDLIVAQTAEQLAELKLKNMLAKHLDDTLAGALVETTDPLPDPQAADQPAFDEALATAMRSRPEIAQAEGNIRNQDVAVEYTNKKLKPAVSLFALLTSAGREGDLTGAWSHVAKLNFPEYAYGFSVSFPIGNRAAQADHQQALLSRQQSETSLQRTRNQIRLEVRNALIGLVQAGAQIAAARMAVGRSRQTLDAEQKKLRAGTSTSYNVIRVQRDLFIAQLAEVQARVGYAKARVEMDRSMGVLLERRGIDLDRAVAGG